MRRFFLSKSEILSGNPVLTGSNVKHVRNVLRLGPGDTIAIFDGEGTEYECKIMSSSPRFIILSVLDSSCVNRESPLHITIAQALLKGSKMDLIIQKLTELGVTTYIPFWTQRSIPKLDSHRAASRHHRWTNIAYETLKQCGRSVVPEIKPLRSFDEIIQSKEEYELKIIYCPENADRSLKYLLNSTPKVRKIISMIGPEGGFTAEETSAARDCGYVRVSLGLRILRGETAAVTAAAILQYVYGDLGA